VGENQERETKWWKGIVAVWLGFIMANMRSQISSWQKCETQVWQWHIYKYLFETQRMYKIIPAHYLILKFTMFKQANYS
jgi:hypothetical protein